MKNKAAKRIFQTTVVGIMAGALVFGAAGCSSSSESTDTEDTQEEGTSESEETAETNSELTTVRAAVMTGNPDHWLALLGEELGFFAEHGLELEISEFAAGINTVDALVTGQADIGFVADYALVNRLGNTSESSDLQIIARFATSGTETYFYVNPEVVTELSDLEGQTIATLPGTVYDYWNAYTIELAGLTTDDVEIASVDSASSGLALLVSGDAVGIWGFGTNKTKLEEAGMVQLLNLNEIGLSTDSYYVATQDGLENNSELISAYLEVIAETEEWVAENQDEAAELVAELLDLDTDTTLANIQSAELVMDFTEETLEHLNDIKDWALENGSFDTDYEIESFLNLDILRELFPDAVEVED